MAAISVRALRVVRGGCQVLHDVSLEVSASLVTGLLGPSGSGKTTLMRAIVGVQQVCGGAVDVLGMPAGSPALRPRVGYVTQAPSVYGDLTVRENLEFFARVLGAPEARIDEVIDTVGLAGERRRVVRQLSGGQRARVSLATAMVNEPDVLVLDEPTVGLDPVLRRDLWKVFRELAAQGRTVLVSSHVMDEADQCDRLLLLREGRLLTDDTPDGVRQQTGSSRLDKAFLRLVEGADR